MFTGRPDGGIGRNHDSSPFRTKVRDRYRNAFGGQAESASGEEDTVDLSVSFGDCRASSNRPMRIQERD